MEEDSSSSQLEFNNSVTTLSRQLHTGINDELQCSAPRQSSEKSYTIDSLKYDLKFNQPEQELNAEGESYSSSSRLTQRKASNFPADEKHHESSNHKEHEKTTEKTSKEHVIENLLSKIPFRDQKSATQISIGQILGATSADSLVLGSFKSILNDRKDTPFKRKGPGKQVLKTIFPDFFTSALNVNTSTTTLLSTRGASQAATGSNWNIVKRQLKLEQNQKSFFNVLDLVQEKQFQKAKEDIAKKEVFIEQQRQNMFSKKDKRKLGIVMLGCMMEADLPSEFYDFLGKSQQIRKIINSFVELSAESKYLLERLCSVGEEEEESENWRMNEC